MFIKRIIKFFKAKWIFFIPQHKELLIYDTHTGIEIINFLNLNYLHLLDTRAESINISILIKSVFNCLINPTKKISQEYFKNYIYFIQPRYVLTLNDLDNTFWYLKNHFKKTIFIAIQKNRRSGAFIGNPFYQIKKKHKNSGRVDYLFLLGENSKYLYLKYFYIKKVISIGSIRNNNIKNITKKKPKSIVFISQYKKWSENSFFLKENGDHVSSHECFLKHDQTVLNFLSKYCEKRKFKLKILSKTKTFSDLSSEINYYQKILNKNKFKFLKVLNMKKCYKLLGQFHYFVTIDSTLGYEASARNKRVAHFDIRHDISNLFEGKYQKYGSSKLKYQGPFWTNKSSESEMLRVMEFIIKAGNIKWKKAKKKFVDPEIIYSYKNKKLLSNLYSIGIKLNKRSLSLVKMGTQSN